MGSVLDRYISAGEQPKPEQTSPVSILDKYSTNVEAPEEPRVETAASRLGDRLNLLWRFMSQGPYNKEFAIKMANEPGFTRAFLRAGKSVIDLPAAMSKRMGMMAYTPEAKAAPSPLDVPIGDLMLNVVGFPVHVAGSLLEAATGVGSKGGELVSLNEDERSKAILETTANVVGLVAAGATGAMVQEQFAKSAVAQLAKTTTAQQAAQVGKQVAGGALKRAMLRGTAEGIAGGVVAGPIAVADEPDLVFSSMIQGVMFAPLGLAFERLRLVGKKTDGIGASISEQAGLLAQVRNLQATLDDSFTGILGKLEGLETADGIAQAVLLGKLDSDDSFVVPSVNTQLVSQLINTVAEGRTNLTPQFHYRTDGLVDVAVLKSGGDKAARSFRETGFIPNQLVTVDGANYIFQSLSKDGEFVNLKSATSDATKRVARDRVRHDPSLRTDATPENVQRLLLEDFVNFVREHKKGIQAGSLTSELVTGEGKAGAGFDPSLITKLGENLYAGDKAAIIIREFLQNSIDAVRAKVRTSGEQGKIDVDITDQIVTITDNGTGMAPEVALNQLLDIGASFKEGPSAGGFGLAKIILFASAEDINIRTTHLGPDGVVRTTNIKGSGQDWINGKLQVETLELPRDHQTGTSIKIQYPSDIKNNQLRDAFDTLLTDGEFPDIVIDGAGDAIGIDNYSLPVSKAFVEKHTLLDGSEAVISIEEGQNYGLTRVVVLNNGIPQFTHNLYGGPKLRPPKVFIDIKPASATTSPDYPFNTSRDNLKGEAKRMMDAVISRINDLAARKANQVLYTTMVEAPKISGTARFRIIEPTKLSDPDFARRVSERDYARDLSVEAEAALDLLIGAILPSGQVPISLANLADFSFRGISLDKKHLAVNIDLAAIRKLIEADPALGPAKAAELGGSKFGIYLNPFMMVSEFGNTEPAKLAAQTYGSLLHELAHNLSRGHHEEYAGALTRIMGEATAAAPDIITRFTEFWSKHLDDIVQDYDIYERLQAANEDILKGHVGHQRAGLTGDDDGGSLGPKQPGQPSESTGAAGEGPRPPSGENIPEGGAQQSRAAASPRGAALIPDAPNLDFETGQPFEQLLQAFAQAKGYSKAELPALENAIVREMIKVDPEIGEIIKKHATFEEQARAEIANTQQELQRIASTNNLYFDNEDAGRIVIRDETGKRLTSVNTIKEAIEFIDKTGQATGSDLGGGGMPPRFPGMSFVPEGEPRFNEAPIVINRNNLFEAWSDELTHALRWFTQPLDAMRAIDKEFGTRLYELADRGMQVRRRLDQAVKPLVGKLENIMKPISRLTRDRREVIGGYIESINKVADATPIELTLANDLFKTGADITNVMRYLDAVNRAAKDGTPGVAEALDGIVSKLKEEFNMGDAELKAAALLQAQDAFRFGTVAKLVRELQRSPVPYAKTHNMTGAEIAAAERLNAFNKELGPETQLLRDAMTHARLYTKGDLEAALRAFGATTDQSSVILRGFKWQDIDAYEADPFMSTFRFIRSREKMKYMDGYVTEALKTIKNEVKKTGGYEEEARGLMNRFMGDIQGLPSASRKANIEMVRRWNKAKGWNLDEDMIHKTVTLIMQTGEAALQGGRILYAGLRDFAQPLILYEARFGEAAAGRALKYGIRGYENIKARQLIELGEIADYDINTVTHAEEFTESVMGRGFNIATRTLNAANKAFFKLSGQGAAYKRVASGIYLDRWKTAGDELLKLSRNEISKDVAYKNLKIQTYEPPVIEAFDRLVQAGKYEDATRFIARATVAENVGLFSQGNRMPWQRSEKGRLFGQFGSWPMWFRRHVQQMTTRGTVTDRVAYITRLGAAQAAFVAAAGILGINMYGWYFPPAVAFMGGPSVETAKTLFNATVGRGVEHDLAVARLKNVLPFSDGEFQVPNVWYPGKLVMQDIAEAIEMANRGDSRAIFRMMGYRPIP